MGHVIIIFSTWFSLNAFWCTYVCKKKSRIETKIRKDMDDICFFFCVIADGYPFRDFWFGLIRPICFLNGLTKYFTSCFLLNSSKVFEFAGQIVGHTDSERTLQLFICVLLWFRKVCVQLHSYNKQWFFILFRCSSSTSIKILKVMDQTKHAKILSLCY